LRRRRGEPSIRAVINALEAPMLATPALPLSAFDLRDAVRQSRRFDPVRLDRVLRLDASRGLVEVQASATWSSVAAYLRPDAPDLAAALRDLGTVGEAVATNAAGPDGRPVVAHIESLTLVTPDGELRRVSRDQHPELFALAVGGQDLFGALYSATLRLESLAGAAAEVEPVERLELPASGAARRSLELLVPPQALEALLAEARGRCAEWRMEIEAVEVRRILPESETALAWARREYAAVRLVLAERRTLGGSVRATQLVRELIDLALSHGGGFPIAATPEATRAQVEACYPGLKRVLAEQRRLDPAGKLSNAWHRHHRALLAERCEVRWNLA
jgi:FAD/FMN-containing dehydrogenase